MSGLETLGWKQAFPRHVPVETVRFQPSVSNVGVGNTVLETVFFEFSLYISGYTSFLHVAWRFQPTVSNLCV